MMTTNMPLSLISGWQDARPQRALVKSMKTHGFMAEFPVIIRPNPDGSPGYVLLDGRRRCAAAAQLNIDSVPYVVSGRGVYLTILAHATRRENPVAELRAYQVLQDAGLTEKDIANMGFATIQRIRKVAKLNRLVPEISARVEAGEIAPSVAFQIATLPQEIQRKLAQEEKITAAVVKEYKTARRSKAIAGLENIFTQKPQTASTDEFLVALSPYTLRSMLDDLPADDPRFAVWRSNIRKALATKEPVHV